MDRLPPWPTSPDSPGRKKKCVLSHPRGVGAAGVEVREFPVFAGVEAVLLQDLELGSDIVLHVQEKETREDVPVVLYEFEDGSVVFVDGDGAHLAHLMTGDHVLR